MQSAPDPDIPVFSIITPTFKRPGLLLRNIKSVLNQTFCDYEHLIIDDANDDKTAELIDSFTDSRIIFLRHEKSRGAAASYNTGIRKSRGKFILFLDDDDEYMPRFLEKVNERFLNSGQELDFIWTGISKIKDTLQGEVLLFTLIWPSIFLRKEDGLVAATSIGNGFGVCVRRECIEAAGLFDETLTVCSDTDFMFRLAGKYNFQTVPESLVKIHQHELMQLTRDENNAERININEILLERYRDILRKYPKMFTAHYRSYADLCYRSGLKVKGRKAMYSILAKNHNRILICSDLISFELTGRSTVNTYFGRAMKGLINLMKRI